MVDGAAMDDAGAMLRVLSDSLPQLLCMATPDGLVDYVNERWPQYTGRSRDELLGMGWMASIRAGDGSTTTEQLTRAFSSDESLQVDYRVRRHDGSWRWFRKEANPVRDESGRITRWVASLTDIDEQKRVQELERRRTRQALLVGEVGRALVSQVSLRDVLARCAQGCVDHLDAAFARIWTVEPRGLVLELEASAGMYTHLDGGHARVPIGKFKIGGIAETRVPHLSNDVQNDSLVDHAWAAREGLVSFIGYPLLIEDRVVGVIAMFGRNIMHADTLDAARTIADAIAVGIERKRGSEALVRSEQRYELAMRATMNAVWDWDLRSDLIGWSDGLGEQFGFAREQVGHTSEWWLSRIHHDDREQVFQSIHAVIDSSERDWSAEYRFMRGDGRYAFVSDRAFVSRDAKQRPVRMVGAMQDITQRRRAERGLQLLARAGVRLATSADTLEACQRIAEIVVPWLADWSIVDLVVGENLDRVAGAHHDRAKRPLLDELRRTAPNRDVESGVAAVVRTGQTEYVPIVTREYAQSAAAGDAQVDMAFALGMASYIRVPLVARGRVLGVLTIVRDATSAQYDAQDVRIVEELALRAALSIDTVQVLTEAQTSEQQLRSLVENLPQLAWSARPDGYTDYYNQRWYEYTGTTYEQVKGMGWSISHDPELLPGVVRTYTESIRLGEPFEMEFPLRGVDGHFRWFLTRVMPLRGPDGRIVRWFGTNTDIDDRRRQAAELERFAVEQDMVQRQLREEADRLELFNRIGRQLASELEVGVIVQELLDVATQLTGAEVGVLFYRNVDSRGDSSLSYATSGMLQDRATRRVHPGGLELIDELANSGVLRLSEEELAARYDMHTPIAPLLREGTVLHSYLAVPLASRMGAALGVLAFGHRDPSAFTDRAEKLVVGLSSQAAIAMDNARLLDEAQRLIAALERSNQELDNFAYVASHDLKAPLRGISNLSQWIEDDIAAIASPETREHLRLMRGRVVRLEALINGVLHYARAGRGKLSVEKVDVGALLEDIFDVLAPPAGVVLRVVTPMPTLTTSRTELQQVLMNFIGNALKYGATIPNDPGSVHVEVSAEELPTQWLFSIADRGKGIAPEFHARIWGLFQTLQSRDVIESTGIGLAVVRKVVENRGGTAWIDSAVGPGATFRFTWPK
ncbi:MAG: PAS domain-containing protein [Polyangia bacterium]